jgi:HEAT repeat protein
MADVTGKKLLELLEPENAEAVRRAAIVVLGEIGTKDNALTHALCAALDDPDAGVRLEAIAAAGKLHIDKALPQLLERIKQGGPESEAAAEAAAKLGARGIKGLQELMGETAPGLRRRIAGAMATGDSTSAETAAVETLLDTDPGVVDAASKSLIAKVPTFTAGQRKAVVDRVLELLKPKKGKQLAIATEVALVRLLAALQDQRGESVFWSRIEAPNPAELRAAALHALGRLSPPADGPALKKLLACLADRDFRVVAPALMILKAAPVGGKNLKDWLPLFAAPDVAVRRFAIERLGGQDSAEVAAGLVNQLKHPDRGLQELALAALARLQHGREAMADALLQAEHADAAWTLARAQTAMAKDYATSLRTRIFAKASAYLEADDRRADALLFLLRESDVKDLRARLAERALALRKKKDYARAITYLRLLGRDPAIGEGLRFELAACGLKVSPKDLAADARAADPALPQFSRLIHSHETDPLDYVKKAAWLAPEDLFYLGFHFAEGTGPEREFGGGLLKLVLKKSPKSQMGKDARAKLRRAGLD